MRLTTAMLADAAQVQGGKLSVLGGGFETVRARTLPVVLRTINLALIFEVDTTERNRDLELIIDLMDEDAVPMGVQARGKLRVGNQPALPPGASSVVPLAVPFYNVRFAEAKGYVFVITHEGQELGRVRLRVAVTS